MFATWVAVFVFGYTVGEAKHTVLKPGMRVYQRKYGAGTFIGVNDCGSYEVEFDNQHPDLADYLNPEFKKIRKNCVDFFDREQIQLLEIIK
jgi:hypothetical protein